MVQVLQYETLLKRRLEALKSRLGEAQKTLTASHSRDWDDQAIEREGDEVVESLSRHDLVEIQAIEAALDRMRQGTYGVCQNCGENITAARLSILPEAALCRNCSRGPDDPFDNVPV